VRSECIKAELHDRNYCVVYEYEFFIVRVVGGWWRLYHARNLTATETCFRLRLVIISSVVDTSRIRVPEPEPHRSVKCLSSKILSEHIIETLNIVLLLIDKGSVRFYTISFPKEANKSKKI